MLLAAQSVVAMLHVARSVVAMLLEVQNVVAMRHAVPSEPVPNVPVLLLDQQNALGRLKGRRSEVPIAASRIVVVARIGAVTARATAKAKTATDLVI